MPFIHKLLFAVLLLIFSQQVFPISGRKLFSAAYKIEKKDIEESISLYRKAIHAGLDKKLQKAAVWKIYWLYLDLKKYPQAIKQLSAVSHYGKTTAARQKLVRAISENLRISEKLASQYIKIASQIIQNNEQTEDTNKQLISSMNRIKNPLLLREIINLLDDRGLQEVSEQYFQDADKTNIQILLIFAEHLLLQKKIEMASEILGNAEIISGDINDDTRAHYFYLKGKLAVLQNEPEAAIEAFKLAAENSKNKKAKDRYNGLIAFEQYKLGDLKGAIRTLSLIKPWASDPNIQLLRILVRVENKGANASENEYEKIRNMIRNSKTKRYSLFLIERARLLVD